MIVAVSTTLLAEMNEKLGFGDDHEAQRARVDAKCTAEFCRQIHSSVTKQKRRLQRAALPKAAGPARSSS